MTLHLKLVANNAAVGHEAFGDWYRFGPEVEADGSALDVSHVVYFGGAISTPTYEARRETEPAPIRELFETALADAAIESVDLLVVPCPLIGRSEPDFTARISTFVLDELLGSTPNPEPSRLVFFGNSAGAHLASTLAFELASVRALVTMGGVGMAEAVRASERRLFAGTRYRCFANHDDPCTSQTHAFWVEMLSRGVAVDVIERPGEHDFDDYFANGSVQDGFAVALESLR